VVFNRNDTGIEGRLSEADQELFLQLSYSSWYYVADLEKLWEVGTQKARNTLARFQRAEVMVSRVKSNHGRQGAPSRMYARADAYDTKTIERYRLDEANAEKEKEDAKSS